MNYGFLFTCFCIGIAAASGIGPIFVLTFNKGALHGLSNGLATALGAAVVDAVFFLLALVGVLAIVEDMWQFMAILDFVGGAILLLLAKKMIWGPQLDPQLAVGKKERLIVTFLHAASLTIVNPLTLLFFMLVVASALPVGTMDLSWFMVTIGACMVALGSLVVLGSVACIASFMGYRINKKMLRSISVVTGIFFLGAGLYLFTQFIMSFR